MKEQEVKISQSLSVLSPTLQKLVELTKRSSFNFVDLQTFLAKYPYPSEADQTVTIGCCHFPEFGLARTIIIDFPRLTSICDNSPGEIETSVAHEIGHLQFLGSPSPFCSWSKEDSHHRYLCEFDETRADLRAIQILRRLHNGLENWHPVVKGITSTAKDLWVEHRRYHETNFINCRGLKAHTLSNCPKSSEVDRLSHQIQERLKT